MKFEVKKTENCFANTQTYEYRLPIENQEFIQFLDSFSMKKNLKLRRPVFAASDTDGVHVKGILKENIIKVSFPDSAWQEHKTRFEHFIQSLQEVDNA